MTTNLRPGPEISSLYAFGSAIYLFDKTRHFVPKPGTKNFVPVSCKRLQKFHTGLSSYRPEFVPVSCKYPLNLPLAFSGGNATNFSRQGIFLGCIRINAIMFILERYRSGFNKALATPRLPSCQFKCSYDRGYHALAK